MLVESRRVIRVTWEYHLPQMFCWITELLSRHTLTDNTPKLHLHLRWQLARNVKLSLFNPTISVKGLEYSRTLIGKKVFNLMTFCQIKHLMLCGKIWKKYFHWGQIRFRHRSVSECVHVLCLLTVIFRPESRGMRFRVALLCASGSN